MSEHTPGPWYCHFGTAIAEQADGEYGYATGITTASEQEFLKDGGRGDLVAWVPHDRAYAANARLIAACPNMLMALRAAQHALAVLDCRDGWPGWRDLDATEVDQLISSTLLHVDRAIACAERDEL